MDNPAENLNLLGTVDWDDDAARHERVRCRLLQERVDRCHFGKLVRIVAEGPPRRQFVARIVGGPYFPAGPAQGSGGAHAELEVQGEIEGGLVVGSTRRPKPGSSILDLSFTEIGNLLKCTGDLLLGALAETPAVLFGLQSKSKEVLPRNVGIFGTVGSGKSNTTQVLIEEAAAAGWAVVLVDVEGEYIRMDQPVPAGPAASQLVRYCRAAKGLADFQVLAPRSCRSERADAKPFCLRLADFEVDVISEILEANAAERQALRDCVEYLLNLSRQSLKITEKEELASLLDGSSAAKLPFSLFSLIQRARDKAPRSTTEIDYTGLLNKLNQLKGADIVDVANESAISPGDLVQAGRVSVFDVSVADDFVKSLVIADLLRKVFALKILQESSAPTLVILEEAHTFISRQDRATMQATLQMLRTVARRGRKRWLGLVFVSQQPGHLPPEIFELCNTRIVHNVRSLHNLEALKSTASDVGAEVWARCPLLRPGEAVVSSPQLDRPCVVQIRPAASVRRFS